MGKLGNFELSEEQRKLVEIKNKRRAELRAQYWKQITDPNRYASGEGGHLFDPAMQRFQAMRVSYTEHFKPTPKSAYTGFFVVVLPIVLITFMFQWDKEKNESKYRNGEVSYKDRRFKFI